MSLSNTSWRELVGFEKDRAKIQSLMQQDRLPSVMLFEGREGIGKSLFLLQVAALHFCETQDACGSCQACVLVASNRHPDLLLIKGDGEALKVSSITEISEFLSFAPNQGSPLARRLVLIIDAEDLTSSAVNKLLVTLEEPARYGRILLSTAKTKHLLATLLSRCVRWNLVPPPAEQVVRFIETKLTKNAELPTKGELTDIMARLSYAPGKILHFLEKQRKGTLGQDVEGLLRCRNLDQVLIFAEKFRNQIDNGLFDFVQEFEYALNRMYRELAQAKTSPMLDEEVLSERRKFLRQLKELVGKQKISLNSQMVLERLGFYSCSSAMRFDASV